MTTIGPFRPSIRIRRMPPRSSAVSPAPHTTAVGPTIAVPGPAEPPPGSSTHQRSGFDAVPSRSMSARSVLATGTLVAGAALCWLGGPHLGNAAEWFSAPLPLLHGVFLASLAVALLEYRFARGLIRDITDSAFDGAWNSPPNAAAQALSQVPAVQASRAAPLWRWSRRERWQLNQPAAQVSWPSALWVRKLASLTNPGPTDWIVAGSQVKSSLAANVLAFDLAGMIFPAAVLLLGGIGYYAFAYSRLGTPIPYEILYRPLLVGFTEGSLLLLLALAFRRTQTRVADVWDQVWQEHPMRLLAAMPTTPEEPTEQGEDDQNCARGLRDQLGHPDFGRHGQRDRWHGGKDPQGEDEPLDPVGADETWRQNRDEPPSAPKTRKSTSDVDDDWKLLE